MMKSKVTFSNLMNCSISSSLEYYTFLGGQFSLPAQLTKPDFWVFIDRIDRIKYAEPRKVKSLGVT